MKLYKLQYIYRFNHNGKEFIEIRKKILNDTLSNIKKKYEIYCLTDSENNVVINNERKYHGKNNIHI